MQPEEVRHRLTFLLMSYSFLQHDRMSEEVWPCAIIYHQVSRRNCECTEKESVRRKKRIYGSTRPLAKRLLQTIIVLNSSYK